MKKIVLFRRLAASGTFILGVVGAAQAQSSSIPYPHMGQYNATSYTFVATTTGDVVGYYAGSDASYDNKIGLQVNGVLTSAGYGLDDHSSSIGQSFDFGHVNAGDTLVFDLNVISQNAHVYSVPALNTPYDASGETVGHNHVYSSSYNATSPLFGNAPPGTYVAFEDQSFPNSDYSYNDENFVFTNVTRTVASASAPEPTAAAVFVVGSLGHLAACLRRKRRR